MENVTATATAATIRQQQQQIQQHQQLQQHHQEQQQQHEHQQQFCLRWHNHQTSLLSTLPVLLDQSHLTDVTISAEGRTLRAHRVVLSACSTFFLELFRTLDTTSHPIIIIPGASFAAIVALLTFMYSGEVNVYEEQIPMLLNLAETLGIKGLADVQNNLQKANRRAATAPPAPPAPPPPTRDFFDVLHKEESDTPPTPPSPPPAPTTSMAPPTLPPPLASTVPPPSAQLPLLTAATVPNTFNSTLLGNKLPTPLESLFLKSLQFYPNLLPQPLNFSQTALNKTNELLVKYQQQCNSLYQDAMSLSAKEISPTFATEDYAPTGQVFAGAIDEGGVGYGAAKRFCLGEKQRTLTLPAAQPPMTHLHYQHQQPHTPSPQAHIPHTLTHIQTNSQQQKDIKRIDKIVENLRKTPTVGESGLLAAPCAPQSIQQQRQSPQQQLQSLHGQLQTPSLSVKTSLGSNFTSTLQSPHLQQSGSKSHWSLSATPSCGPTQSQLPQHHQQHSHKMPYLSAEEQVAKLQQQIDQFASCSRGVATTAISATGGSSSEPKTNLQSDTNLLATLTEKPPTGSAHAASMSNAPNTSPQQKPPSNSKLYATCFICHKQLSNQYNLRVHLETHQNVRYACNVCSHVSRSKDALRKHVSYRHPGAPSPCESEARRKRASKATNASPPVITVTTPTSTGNSSSGSVTPTSPAAAVSAPFQLNPLNAIATPATVTAAPSSGTGGSTSAMDAEAQMVAAAQLSSAYMFLPNQFHLAAAAAAAAQQQQQQQQHQQLQNALDASNTAAAVAALSFAATSATSALTTTTAANGEDSNVGLLAGNMHIKREPSPAISSPGTRQQISSNNNSLGGGTDMSPTNMP